MFQQQPLQFAVMVREILRKERVLLGTVRNLFTHTQIINTLEKTLNTMWFLYQTTITMVFAKQIQCPSCFMHTCCVLRLDFLYPG